MTDIYTAKVYYTLEPEFDDYLFIEAKPTFRAWKSEE
jgi:hypothetical protein